MIHPATREAYNLFHKGSQVLAEMENNGIRIDVGYLKSATEKVGKRIKKLQLLQRESKVWKEWIRQYGQKANMGSRLQLGKVLFDLLQFPYPGGDDNKTGTGRYRTDDVTLAGVNVPFVKRFLKIEKLKKAKSTYLDGLAREVVDGYVHPVFNLHLVDTFRGSCDSPNVQNVPARDEEFAEIIRRCYIPRKGRVFVERDFGALEFRVIAVVWRDPKMIEYVSDHSKDIHRDMAARCYLLNTKDVNRDTRYCGKNGFVFPRCYGSFYKQIAKNMWLMIDDKKLTGPNGIPMREHLRSKGIRKLGNCDPQSNYHLQKGTFEYHIKEVEDWFFNEFSTYRETTEKWIADYRKRGWFQTVTGFVIQGLYSNNFLLNAPIQSSGFHILLWCLIQKQKELRRRKMQTLLVANIHDCSLADVPENEVQDYINLTEEIMTVDVRKVMSWIEVPLEAECEICVDSWWNKKPWVKTDGVWGPKTK